MVQPFILFFFFALQALILLTTARESELMVANDAENRDAAVRLLAAGINNYYIETNTFPASFAALGAATGYEYLRNTARPFQSLAIASNLNDGTFTFKRIVVYTQDPYRPPYTDTTYLGAANNTCGTGDFATATEWCGPNNANAQWWKQDERDAIAAAVAREKHRLTRLLQKFNAWYNDDISVSTTPGVLGNNYPDPGATSATLITLVTGFAQTATTCTGIYTWRGIPIDCTDLYSVWGTPTVYNYVSPTHIVLLTKTPYTKADGTALYVSTEESL
ncbi:hypothetical protein RHDC4_02179 [Rhodocyclaceae bacterium]|nr:hypothetical protein RHDC4_02179 [Rhodocyclaceae bacterium]